MSAVGTAREYIQVPIAALPRICATLAVVPKGSDESIWQKLRAEIDAQCELCGIKLSAEELTQLAQADGESALSRKLERIRLQYCARNGCESRFYRISFIPETEGNWTILKETVTSAAVLLPELPPPRLSFVSLVDRRALLVSVAAALVAVIAYFLLRHWLYGYRIPLIQKKHIYRANPVHLL